MILEEKFTKKIKCKLLFVLYEGCLMCELEWYSTVALYRQVILIDYDYE